MTTDLTMTEADDRFTNDTKFVRLSPIQDRIMSICRTRNRKKLKNSKVPNTHDDIKNVMINNRERVTVRKKVFKLVSKKERQQGS